MSNKARRPFERCPCAIDASTRWPAHCAARLPSSRRVAPLALFALASALLAGCGPDERACCRDDDECALGARCFEGMCARACADDAQCSSGERCSAGVCVAPSRGESHCPFNDKRPLPAPRADAGPVVDDDAGTPPGECEDPFEPNDERGQATDAPSGTVSASICPSGDSDYFRVVTTGPVELHASVAFRHADGDIDLELLDESGERVIASQHVFDVEDIRIVLEEAGAWFVHAYGFGGAENEYQLLIEALPLVGQCADELYEDNDDAESAFALELPTVIEAAFCSGDEDFYRGAMPAATTAWVSLTSSGADELHLEVRRAGGAVLGENENESGRESVFFALDQPDDVVVRIHGAGDRVDARTYWIGWQLFAGGSCVDDHEPNELPATATPVVLTALNVPVVVDAESCEGDVDFYRLAWPEATAAVHLALEGDGLVSARLYEEDDMELFDEISAGMITAVVPTASRTSDHVLVVVGAAGEQGSYQLTATAFLGD